MTFSVILYEIYDRSNAENVIIKLYRVDNLRVIALDNIISVTYFKVDTIAQMVIR